MATRVERDGRHTAVGGAGLISAGAYTLKVGVFGSRWSPLYVWNDNAATFNVGTTTVTNPSTPVPPTATSTNTPTTVPLTATKATASPTAAGTPAPLTLTWNHVGESATSIKASATETFTATITANQSIANELMDFEVYNSAGVKVWQTYQSPVSFTANTATRFTASWATSSTVASVTYMPRMSVFTSTWSTCEAWNGNAATFSAS